MRGLVILKNRSQIIIEDENKNKYEAEIRGILRKSNASICVGDYVEYEYDSGLYLINKIYDRKSILIRPKVANVNKIFIVQSTIQPDYNELLIDKMMLFYLSNNIDISIILTKSDVYYDDKIKNSIKNYIDYGISVYDSNNHHDFNLIKSSIKNNIVCFVGNSGVGKSTLINKLDPTLNLKTQETSKALNRGKHTTTTTTLYSFLNGKIVDSPGFSTINFDLKPHDIAYLFFKSNKYKFNCKFNDCIHINEKGCDIKKKLLEDKIISWRYNNYLKLLKGVKND